MAALTVQMVQADVVVVSCNNNQICVCPPGYVITGYDGGHNRIVAGPEGSMGITPYVVISSSINPTSLTVIGDNGRAICAKVCN